MCVMVLSMRARTKGMGDRGEILNEFGEALYTRKSIVAVAKELRRAMTRPEQVLWKKLRKNPHDIKFYRQAPIDRFIVDFFCPGERLVIEIDGDIHDIKDVAENDVLREKFLRRKNLRVLRFRNEEVMHDVQSVLQQVFQACRRIHPFSTKKKSVALKNTHSPSAPA